MKRSITFFSVFLLLVLVNFFSTSCTTAEKQEQPVEKTVIQLGEQEIQECDEAIYKTREFRGQQRPYLSVDFSGITKPTSLDEFTKYFHNPPVRQYSTGTCWCFATTSFLESELHRLGKGEIKLSEMYTVYWEYVERAKYFIQHKGEMSFGEGSEHNAVTERMKVYGAVPAEAYTGLLEGQTEHNHGPLSQEIRKYLTFCKDNNYWDEEKAVLYVKQILNKHIGAPPETIEVNGQSMTPKEYLDNVLQLRPEDYVSFMSLKSLPFYTKGEYKVPDNWWHSADYHNVPLDVFYDAIVSALKKGFTVDFGGDVSEPGINSEEKIGMVPCYDIPFKLINQDSREFRFSNRTTSDDHAIHAVGISQHDGHDWFLIKDSGRGAHGVEPKGYSFFRDDYVKLKMLTIMVHKDAVSDILAKFAPVE